MQRLRGMAAAISGAPPAREMESPAWAAVAGYGAPAGDGGSHRHGLGSGGDGESCPGSGRCLCNAGEGQQLPSAGVHQLGKWSLLPSASGVQ